jgi:hypothetical protein
MFFILLQNCKIVMMLESMPAVMLTSRLCPKGLEATYYALLAGFSDAFEFIEDFFETFRWFISILLCY